MRRLGRIRLFDQEAGLASAWPLILLFVAASVPALCLLWLMTSAMRNERLAAREKLAQAYRGQLESARDRFEASWNTRIRQIASLTTNSPAQAFAQVVALDLADSAILVGSEGRMLYPDTPRKLPAATRDNSAEWAAANQIEFLHRDYLSAALKYDALAQRNNVSPAAAARALQAEVRCLLRAGRKGTALQVITDKLRSGEFENALDPDGRSIVANAELLALELIGNHAQPLFQAIVQSLAARLNNYTNSVLAAPQRRFVMKGLRELALAVPLPTLDAEELAARFAELAHPISTATSSEGVVATGLPGVWQFQVSTQVVALFTTARLATNLVVENGTRVALLPPGASERAALLTVPAGTRFPGWHLALSLLQSAPPRPTGRLYLWTGLCGLGVMLGLAMLAVRLTRRQLALARLKTDLAALVSHELKTPLSAMRVLVDTLLQEKKEDSNRTREYLQLIAQENERLSRLIEQFLCFSRLERKKGNFAFALVPPGEIAETAAAALRHRLSSDGCQFQVQVEPALPSIRADSGALTTALVNLLDNAYKFSGAQKHIALRARANNGHVIFSVDDNGTGIPAREAKRIFRPFYQVDQRLARSQGGVGLGLSIVQQVVHAHGGETRVESEPGRGTSISIVVPAVSKP